MLIGHDKLVDLFTGLNERDKLSHAYIFFGEPNVGKRTFAVSLANYLEKGEFKYPDKVLTEFLEVSPNTEGVSESIGIDEMRSLKNFLYQKPVNSSRRVAVIDEAELMTDQAQNAILKIAEEPPERAILILIVSNPEALIKTVQSRFQKIYFPKIKSSEIVDLLIKRYSLSEKEAMEISEISFGRPGRAISLVEDKSFISIKSEAKDFLNGKRSMKDVLSELADIENKHKIRPFLTEVMAELSKDPIKNTEALKSINHGLRMLAEWNVNRKMQIEAVLQSLN